MQPRDSAELQSLLAHFPALITYSPLRTEVPLSDVLTLPEAAYCIPARASLDPAQEVSRAREAAGDQAAAVLMPGRQFDVHGTRIGQGGGWYDRFLAAAPVLWLRVGFCFDDQFSRDPLPRNTWDQPVDVVCVFDRTDQTLHCHPTTARAEFSGTLFT